MTSVPTGWLPATAFEFTTDVRSFVRWDPAVESGLGRAPGGEPSETP